MQRVMELSQLAMSEAAAADVPNVEDTFPFVALRAVGAEFVEHLEDGYDNIEALVELTREHVRANNFGFPLVREVLHAAAHLAGIVVNDGENRGFSKEDQSDMQDMHDAFCALAGLDFSVKNRTFHHPHVILPDLIIKAEFQEVLDVFVLVLRGLGTVSSYDEQGERSKAARRLFLDMNYDDDRVVSPDAMIMRSRLQTYDLYYMARENLVAIPRPQRSRIAVGVEETGEDVLPEDIKPALAGGRALHALRGPQIPANFEKYAKTERIGDTETKVLELYASDMDTVEFTMYAAFGFPRTLAEVKVEQENVAATANNRIARFCRRIDALIRVGLNPTVLVQHDWNMPAEVLRTIVEERVRVGRPLAISDLDKIEDAHSLV